MHVHWDGNSQRPVCCFVQQAVLQAARYGTAAGEGLLLWPALFFLHSALPVPATVQYLNTRQLA